MIPLTAASIEDNGVEEHYNGSNIDNEVDNIIMIIIK